MKKPDTEAPELPVPVEDRFRELEKQAEDLKVKLQIADKGIAVLRQQALASRTDRQILESVEETLALLVKALGARKK